MTTALADGLADRLAIGDARLVTLDRDLGASFEPLDDDAFFASLREAVRDDEPLGPRDDYDELDDPDENRKLFRRRR